MQGEGPGLPELKRPALTFGELLTAITIIGALSALTWPALTSARAQAGQAVCLANVRSVALAVRMYLADWDAIFPPRETSPRAVAYFNHFPGKGSTLPWEGVPRDGSVYCHRSTQANPYLRWPVLLDQYLISREVWRCPSARLEGDSAAVAPACCAFSCVLGSRDRAMMRMFGKTSRRSVKAKFFIARTTCAMFTSSCVSWRTTTIMRWPSGSRGSQVPTRCGRN